MPNILERISDMLLDTELDTEHQAEMDLLDALYNDEDLSIFDI